MGKNGQEQLVSESGRYVAKYRDGFGQVQIVPTGCRDEQAARRVLTELERQAELVRSGVLTPTEATVAGHRQTPLAVHFDAFEQHLWAKAKSDIYRSYSRR